MRKFFFFFLLGLFFLLESPSNALAFLDRNVDCTNQSFSCFSNKYGFGTNPQGYSFSAGSLARMAEIKPYAIRAAQVYNSISGHDKVEPQMLVWWAVYDTGGIINYSNCNDQGTPGGYTYNTWITNCNNPWLWQMGYGAQFSHVKIIQEGFSQLYGDQNNTALVQSVGQKVLSFDKTIPTSPSCGGYSCTFPALTMGQIMSGVNSSGHNLGVLPQDNWWAAVLLRNPFLNAYNMADILTVDIINRDAVCSWRGNYCSVWWGSMTNSLAKVVSIWNTIPNTGNPFFANGLNPNPTSPPIPTSTTPPTPTPTFAPPPCMKFNKLGSCLEYNTAFGPISTNVSLMVKTILSILLAFVGGVAVLLIIGAGYGLVVSQGNPEKVKDARERLIAAIIGLLFLVFSIAILQIIGVDILQIPGLSR